MKNLKIKFNYHWFNATTQSTYQKVTTELPAYLPPTQTCITCLMNAQVEDEYCRILKIYKINENKMITIINDDDFGIKTIGREANTFILKGLWKHGYITYFLYLVDIYI